MITDLKQRGMLEGTLFIRGGEFGRTACSQGKLTEDNYGRRFRLTDVHGHAVKDILS